MMDLSDQSTLSDLLAEQYRLATELRENIDAVATAIAQHEAVDTGQPASALEALLQDKSRVLDALEKHNNTLQSWLRDHGFAENDVSAAIAESPQCTELTAQWKAIQAVIGECRLQNTANNALVQDRIGNIHKVLDLLTGNSDDSSPAYTEKGKAGASESRSRPWARA